MIYDKIDNNDTYRGISEDIRIGLEWIRDVKIDIVGGVSDQSEDEDVCVGIQDKRGRRE